MTKAIAKTINLCSNVSDPRQPTGRMVATSHGGTYREFWRGMFSWIAEGNDLPPIITFNYDLVLELSLLQILNNTIYSFGNPLPFNHFSVNYHHIDTLDQTFAIQQTQYGFERRSDGTATRPLLIPEDTPRPPISILKLHGSLNFPKKARDGADREFAVPVEDPHILPPISNKLSEKSVERMWRQALMYIRGAKNVVFVGYSLPSTDIYMQYFLRAAFGPNKSLNAITVFDPVLFGDSPGATAMKGRFADCFSTQIQKRINFAPSGASGTAGGTTAHFVEVLQTSPQAVFF